MRGGNHTGGLQAAATNKARHGADYYVRIGALGGKKSRGGGVTGNHDRAVEIGRLGGAKKQTHCKRGHELTPDNIYVTMGRTTKRQRICKTCRRAKSREYYWRDKVAR